MFCGLCMLHFLYSFICCWIFRLFPILAIVKITAMNMGVLYLLEILISLLLDKYSEVGWLDYMVAY